MESSATQPLSGVRVIDFTQVMLGPCARRCWPTTAPTSSRSSGRARAISRAPRSRRSGRPRQSGVLQPQPQQALHRPRSAKGGGQGDRLRPGARSRCRREQFPRRRDGAHGLRLRRAGQDQSAHHLRLRHRLRPKGPLCPQGRPGHPGAGDDRGDGRKCNDASRSPSIRPRSATIPRACIWCRRSCSRCCNARRRGAASRSRSRCSNPCWRCRCRKRRCGCSATGDFSWGAYPLTGAFETTRRRPRAGRRVQDQSAAGHLRCARPGRPFRRSALRDLRGPGRTQGRIAGDLPRALRVERTELWIARLEEQDLLCAPVLTLAEALAHEQTEANGMVVALNGDGRSLPVIGYAGAPGRGRVPLRRAPPALGADGDGDARRSRLFGRAHRGSERTGIRRMSVLFSVARSCRARHDRPAGAA